MNKGVGFGIFSGALWGIDGFLLSLLFLVAPYNHEAVFYLAPLVGAALHDGFSAAWLVIFNLFKGNGKKIIKVFTKSKDGFIIFLAALSGGPFAMSCYLLSIYLVGPCYSLIITAAYPVLGAVLSARILKEKITRKVWTGIFCTVLGVIVLNYGSVTANYEHFYLGIFFAAMAAVGWALEGVISTKQMNKDLDPDIAIGIREVSSFSVYLLVIVPAISGLDMFIAAFSYTSLAYMGIIALFGSASFLLWYRSMDAIGVGRGMALNITYALWAVVLNLIFTDMAFVWEMLIGGLFVTIGSCFVVLGGDAVRIEDNAELAVCVTKQ